MAARSSPTLRPQDLLGIPVRAVDRLRVQRKAELDSDDCPNCQTQGVQAKLTIGGANDEYEREADRIAETVVNAGDVESPRPTGAGVQRQSAEAEGPDDDLPIQAKRHGGAFEAATGFRRRLDAAKGGGSPLSIPTREFMESRFGYDFSAVRVHAGASAASLTKEIRSRAFAHGTNLYFSPGQYQPGSRSGVRLLAHELAHVIQQGKGANRAKKVQRTYKPRGRQWGQQDPQ